MALLPHPCLPFFSFATHEKPPHITPRPSNFHLSPFPINPPAVHRFGKHHRLVVSQHSSPTAFMDSSSEKPTVVRRESSYRPPMWDSRFMESLNEGHLEHEAFTKMRIEELMEKVKNMFIYANDPSQKINLVDTIERLGLAHHFNKEIQCTLQQVYEDNTDFGENLHVVALRFLLLRQHGYHVSCGMVHVLDVFMKFKDKEGSFKQSLRNDARGLLSLYEASHCSIHGEDILDSSLGFTRQLLKSMVSRLEPTFARRVQRSLELPPQRSLPRLEAKHFISFYEDDASRNDALLELSKMDFNLIQSLEKSEIKEVYRWWKELDLGEKLPYARDRVVECYLCGMEMNFLPEFSNGRIMLGKLINLLAVIDDTYDTYGTLEEIELFTDAINRWYIEAMDQLPEYLRLPYHALYKLVNESNYMSTKHRENNGIYYIKKAV